MKATHVLFVSAEFLLQIFNLFVKELMVTQHLLTERLLADPERTSVTRRHIRAFHNVLTNRADATGILQRTQLLIPDDKLLGGCLQVFQKLIHGFSGSDMTSFGRLVVLLESSHSPSLPSMLSSSFRGLLTLYQNKGQLKTMHKKRWGRQEIAANLFPRSAGKLCPWPSRMSLALSHVQPPL
mmetsp:Transcript_18748/g.47664  ORF Transcript_18748/g.47664 Transcript_18748/m.47664 type:complete len:182 (-) Transcript_18748:1616-2161(-)